VTLADRAFGGVTTRQAAAYVVAQLTGGAAGAVAANLMFDLPAVEIASTRRSGAGLWLAEVLATFGLIVLIFALVRSRRTSLAPFAVGTYITGAYWWSSSTSFANPMIGAARTLSDTFAGIAPSSVPMFVLAQLAGAALAVVTVALLYPDVADAAGDVVVPHQATEGVT
jgi:arsenate reductase